MKKIIQFIIIITAGLFLNSCYYDELDPVSDIPTDPDDPGYVEILYGADIQPIWDGKCTTCHNANHVLDLRADVSYDELVPDYVIADDADNSPLYIKLLTNHGNASDSDMVNIKAWINQGAHDN